MRFIHFSRNSFSILTVVFLLCAVRTGKTVESVSAYPSMDRLTDSPGNSAYYINPATGSDTNSGRSAENSWQTFAPLNRLKLASGDKVIVAPGFHRYSLKPSGGGAVDSPVVIEFTPGRHEFGVEKAVRRAYYISNSSDYPRQPRPIGILLEHVHDISVQGGGVAGPKKTDIVFTGRMTEFVNDHADNIIYTGLTFDLKRPTVSEFRVLKKQNNNALIEIAEGSSYTIKNGTFRWTGDLGIGNLMAQDADPETGRCMRIGRWNPFNGAKAFETAPRKVRLTYAKGVPKRIIQGHQYQFRNIIRDIVGGFNKRCRNIVFRDVRFYALTGMGVISQFSENLTFERADVIPPPDTMRTCPAWADCFHFSGCRGNILVDACRFSGTQDDPINVHGTHLRILRRTADNQLLLRFMQNQTYGIRAFQPGDVIAVIDHRTLREIEGNPRRKVLSFEPLSGDKTGRQWLLTLDGPAPSFGKNDVIDNITWYPSVTIRNCYITLVPTRGFLITTRKKVLVESNTFNRCHMPAILVEDDAEGWFESGPIRDMTIRRNTFIGCGIRINPHNGNNNPNLPVHENILIENNLFKEGAGITVKSTRKLRLLNNRTTGDRLPVRTTACTDIKVEGTRVHEE